VGGERESDVWSGWEKTSVGHGKRIVPFRSEIERKKIWLMLLSGETKFRGTERSEPSTGGRNQREKEENGSTFLRKIPRLCR